MAAIDQIRSAGAGGPGDDDDDDDGGGLPPLECVLDPYYSTGPALEDWDKVVLLLSFDEADGTLVLVDSSSYADNRTLNSGAGAAISTDSSKFGTASLKCTQVNPEGTSWTDTRFQWLSGRPATIEGWFRKVSAQNYTSSPIIFRLSNQSGTSQIQLAQYSTGNTLSIRQGIDATEEYAYTPGPDGYVHWAVTHDGNQTIKFFINGIDTRTWSGSGYGLAAIVAPWTLYIAGLGSQTLPAIEFYIDEFRFWNGKLVYPGGNFTPPTAAFPRDTSDWDPDAPRTVLLVHANEAPLEDVSGYQTKTIVITNS